MVQDLLLSKWQKKSKHLQICVRMILIALMLTEVVIIYTTVSFQRTFMLYLMKREKQKIFSELSCINLKAFELLICYFVGLYMCQFFRKKKSFTENKRLMAFWNGISFLLAICELTHVCIIHTGVELLQAIVKSSLFEGMEQYLFNSEWKLFWDQIQYYYKCCGVNGYDDWKIVLCINDEEKRCAEKSYLENYVFIPYSCCKRTAPPCLQTYEPHMGFETPNINISEINSNGCLSKLIDISVRYHTNIVYLVICVVILHVVLLMLQIMSFFEVKQSCVSGSSCDERPLIIVKYPRNIRCIACTNDSLDDESLPETRRISDCHILKADTFLH